MADELEQIKNIVGGNKSNIVQEYNSANTGLNLDQTVNQVAKGKLTYALNAAVENFDASSVNYQNEPGNELCLNFPEEYHLIGTHHIVEQAKHIFFLTNPTTGASEIGYMDNNDCIYHTLINGNCLNFNINYPIHKSVHKITNCTTEVYWTDGFNSRRYINIDDITDSYKIKPGTDVCNNETIPELDCNKLKIQPNFSIPLLDVFDVNNTGNLTAGTYQFAIQYCDSDGNAYTSYYSITNPTPIANPQIITPDFNYPVGKAIVLDISNIDTTGYFQYYNLAVIKTVNAITSVELVGTYFIDDSTNQITYTGQNVTQIRLTTDDVFEKFPYYDIAQDLTAVQDILIWDQLTSIDRINYQKIANQINLKWQTYKLPADENYADELNATNLRGYLRDEVYAFEIVFLLKNGKQTDGFHIPGRELSFTELIQPDVPNTNPDFIGSGTSAPYWKIYNTSSVIGDATGDPIENATPYKYGEFAYWESTDVYPCNENVWGTLANQPIRHHKFPDVLVSPIFESGQPTIVTGGKYAELKIENRSIFPIGIRLDAAEIERLIVLSDLTQEEKDNIAGFKIVRGDRSVNKSIVAKGILRNVGKYEREGTSYYFPNYPYNDVSEDPFLLNQNNSYNIQCNVYKLIPTSDGSYSYTDCNTNTQKTDSFQNGINKVVCSLTVPVVNSGTISGAVPTLLYDTAERFVYTTYELTSAGITVFNYTDPVTDTVETINVNSDIPVVINVKRFTVPIKIGGDDVFSINQTSWRYNNYCYPDNLNAFTTDESKYRHVLNSPDTSFGSPFLGNILKLESAIYGAGTAHFVEVKKHSLYKLLSREAQEDALQASALMGAITSAFNASAMFATYQSYLTIYINGITRKNFTYSYNSIAEYDYWAPINNDLGIKQRQLDIVQYLIPGVQNVGDSYNINNYERESSIYLKTDKDVIPFPFPSDTQSLSLGSGESAIDDLSRYVVSKVPNVNGGFQSNCARPNEEFGISTVSYYGSIKNIFENQWGQMYSYNTIDTGFQRKIDSTSNSIVSIFGGDTFINKFSFKTKLPFFIDNRVGAPDDSDIFYDEIGNVAYPQYWYSARSILYDWEVVTSSDSYNFSNIISIKANHLDCPNNQLPNPLPTYTPPVVNPDRTFYNGKMYLFAYGIPTFYCESSVNVDLRQAFNSREGEFYPHVSTGIPDEWLQESFVTIAQDNTYYYNATFSKQNKENFFSHLPVNWTKDDCLTNYPFRAVYSDKQQKFSDNNTNNWLIYRPLSLFDFPQNYGKLTSLDGIENRKILARFENKSLLYNNLLTINTSNPQAAYVGNPDMFSAPPIDFAETDLGYVGSQNKMLLKIPQGQITVDAKRGQVFLITGNGVVDLSAFGSGLNRFFTDHLAFEILRYFPSVNTDNHFNGVGLHGVYDSKYDRVIISKLDYIPLSNNIKYDPTLQKFYINEVFGNITVKTFVDLTDSTYFCNKSWTLSYNVNTQSWVSFHSYIPNWYIAENNFFYSGLNDSCDLEVIAAEEVPTTTTTTSTTIPVVYDCDLVGEIYVPNCDLDGTIVPLVEFTVGAPSGVFSAVCPASLTGWYVDTWFEVNGTIYSFGTTETFNLPHGTVITIKSIVKDDYYIYNPGAGFQYCAKQFEPYIDATINGVTTNYTDQIITQGLTEGTGTPDPAIVTYVFTLTYGNTYAFTAYATDVTP